jgi:hypothetical protein
MSDFNKGDSSSENKEDINTQKKKEVNLYTQLYRDVAKDNYKDKSFLKTLSDS